MFHNRLLVRIVSMITLVITMFGLGTTVPASAAANVHLGLGPVVLCGSGCSYGDYTFSFTPNNSDFAGVDIVATICYNVNGGGITDVDSFGFTTSSSPIPTFHDACDGFGVSSIGLVNVNGSQRVAFYDVGSAIAASICSSGDNTVACANWITSHGTLLATISGSVLNFTDGRCNQEPWQAFAAYPDNKGGYIFYAINDGIGYYAMHVTYAQLKANPDNGANHIIFQNLGVQLYRLAGGVLQANRIGKNGKLYSFNLTLSCPQGAPSNGKG